MSPIFPLDVAGPALRIGTALVFGLGFGWFLERGGLGNAKKIAAQFYFTDLTVLKVMMSAIVTTAVGIVVLGAIGMVDTARLYVPATFVLPQLIGGLVFGVGFLVGGLCPGTSCVAAASGRRDGLMLIAGMLVGIAGFNELFPLLAGFYDSTPLGAVTLPGLLEVPEGVAIVGLVAMAGAAFVAAEWLEGRATKGRQRAKEGEKGVKSVREKGERGETGVTGVCDVIGE